MQKNIAPIMVVLAALLVVLAPSVAWAGPFLPISVLDQTSTQPLANPAPSTYQPRYISGFGSGDTFTLFFEDRDTAGAISFASTSTGVLGLAASATATNIIDTHFVVKDWPITIGGTSYAYRGWGSAGNDPSHNFYVSSDLTNWTLVSTFTIPNATTFTGAKGGVYYGFHDVIEINGTYYAFAESNQSQTMLVRSANGDHVWESFASVGGRPGDGPLELPAGVTYGWTPTGSFFDLGFGRGMGKVCADPRDSAFYLAINTAAVASLPPADLEAAFINPANWTWHDGSIGPAASPILAETAEHDLRECWLVPSGSPNGPWNIIYDADYGTLDGGKALGWATLAPPAPPDGKGPITSDVAASPNPAQVGASVLLSAVVDDSTTGGSNIASAEYSVDGGPWTAMDAEDGAFDAVSESVTASVAAPTTPGLYDLCVRGTDAAGNVGAEECALLVVYDPTGGFVTGGGWIDSPEGAMPPIETTVTVSGVSGDTSVDPDAAYAGYYLRYVGNPPPSGYDPTHNYQWASPAAFVPSPENRPVILQGSIDVDEQVIGQVAMIGLLDRDDLATGNSSFQRGAYIYVYRSSVTSWRIGLSDGNAGGEIVQTFAIIAASDLPTDGVLNVEFTLDGTSDGTNCAAGPASAPAGCMTLRIWGGLVDRTLTDSYGDVKSNTSASPEFANGAVLGWDDYLGSNVGYTLSVPSVTSGSPAGRATFGFVSKYKKGADTPDGNTQFTFQAAGLDFHSTSYDWLVINQGGSNAQFKGAGTINGAGEYKFMLWATDGAPDTFRIKIWYEENGGEVVVYDNGVEQAIGGGNIVVHKAK